ncbi:unnamed protein product, partial [Rotaria sp. Silwood2]
KECRNLLATSLNVEMPDDVFKQMFDSVHKARRGVLSSAEFLTFFKMLTLRTDLYEIMKKFVKIESQQAMDKICMDQHELLNFLRLTRNDNMKHIDSLLEAQKLIDEFEMNHEFKQKGFLSLDGFRNMLLSKQFDITESPSSHTIYQDMTNYLFYSQVSGDSNPEAYNRVLLMGCRAVEFDCYDGNDGKP